MLLQLAHIHVTLHVSAEVFLGSVAYPRILFGGGVQQIQLRTENKENGDLGVVATYSGVLGSCNLV